MSRVRSGQALDWQPQVRRPSDGRPGDLLGHPVRDGRRDREDHDRPARRSATRSARSPRQELIEAFDLARDDPAIGVVVLTGRGTARLLLRRRPGRPRGRRLRRRARDRPPQRPRPPDPDPPAAEARDRDGRRLRDRRRARAAPVLRPHDRRGQRPIRADRSPRRLVRRRLRDRAAGPADRREAGQGGLVPLPAVRRGDRALVGPGQRRRARWRSSRRRRSAGRRRCSPTPPSRSDCSSPGTTPASTASPGVQQLAGDATLLYYMSEEAQEGRDAYVEKRRPDFSRFPKRP